MSRRDFRRRVYDDVDYTTRHWSKYLKDYNRYAEPGNTFKGYVSELYQPVQRLWRSASASSLSSYRDLQYERGNLRRSSSYSSLAPSNAIRFRERSVERYVPTYRAYTPKRDEWYRESGVSERSASNSRYLREKSASHSGGYGSRYYSTHPVPSRSSYPSMTTSCYQPPTMPNFTRSGSYNVEYHTRRFYKPTSYSRLDYPHVYFAGQLKGLEIASSFLFRNYDLDDDRRMLHAHSPVQSLKSPHVYRQFQNSWYQYTPGRVFYAYHNRTRY